MLRKLTYILTILFTIYSIPIYGNYNNPYSYSGYRSTSIYIEPARKPVTQNSGRIYQSTYAPGYNSNHTFHYGMNSGLNSNYNTGYSGAGRPGGPRRSPERPDPDNSWSDWWRMNAWDWLGGDSNWPEYVDDDYWSIFWELYGDSEYGDYAQEWWEQNHPGETPPWAVPIGDPGIAPLILATSLYIFIKRRKRIKLAANFLLYNR